MAHMAQGPADNRKRENRSYLSSLINLTNLLKPRRFQALSGNEDRNRKLG